MRTFFIYLCIVCAVASAWGAAPLYAAETRKSDEARLIGWIERAARGDEAGQVDEAGRVDKMGAVDEVGLIDEATLIDPVGQNHNKGRIPEVERQIKKVVHAQSKAVNRGDWEKFAAHLLAEDDMYVQERRRWFADAVATIDSGTFALTVESIAPYKPDILQVRLRQTYKRNGVAHVLEQPVMYVQTKDGWKDADVQFYTKSGERATVKYTDKSLVEQATVALNVAEKALMAFQERLEWQIEQHVQIKLYHQREAFRQSVKLSLPHWVAGWNESGQAIKFIGAVAPNETFASGIVHELTHQLLSEETRDNAAYWMQEGLAEYYQHHLLPGLRTRENMSLKKPRWTFAEMERLNLEQLSAREAAAYYAHCYDLLRYYIQTFGEQKLNAWCAALKMYPEIDAASVDKRSELNARTRAAFEQVTKHSFQSFVADWYRRAQE
ncbi:peptidase MA family metallohydrolase [Numidum massiliense]|uniref:peptidase MA family metallohydrolase n=1 Tax=Numidum massiliense TaxID=1522315 RepID=UPI0006D56177|nr:hypothetical protein [Numidum massiliense]